MVTGLVSGFSLANHSDSESFLVVHALFSQDGCQREGFWEVVGQVVSPLDLSQTLLVGGGLLVPYSLSGSPVIKQLMQMVTMVPGQGGWFSQCASPNSSIPGSARSTGEGIGYPLQYFWASLVAQLVKNLPSMQETWVQALGWENPLEEGMATHSSILAWRIPMDRGAWWATVHEVAKSWT